MTEYVLSLVPDYGLLLVFGVVMIACLAVPLPASMLVLASGSFAATGDLILWQVIGVTVIAFFIGDQIAFQIANWVGPPFLSRIRNFKRMAPMVDKGEAMLAKHGVVAVMISHTIASPSCPYVTYISGATNMNRSKFSVIALLGAIIWATGYVLLGYGFADQLTQVSEMLGSIFIAFVALVAMIGFGQWLRHEWEKANDG